MCSLPEVVTILATGKSDGPARKRRLSPKSFVEAVFAALDDVAALRQSAQFIADNIGELSESAAGINRHAEKIAEEIATLTEAASGIDESAEKIATGANAIAEALPKIQRMAEVVDPLETTVSRLGWMLDRIPGGKRG